MGIPHSWARHECPERGQRSGSCETHALALAVLHHIAGCKKSGTGVDISGSKVFVHVDQATSIKRPKEPIGTT